MWLGDREILWGQRGKIITEYVVDGATDHTFSILSEAIGEAVSESYEEMQKVYVEEVQYKNDYGKQPRTVTGEWEVNCDTDWNITVRKIL